MLKRLVFVKRFSATNSVHTLGSLLKDLSDRVNDADKQRIMHALGEVGSPSPTAIIPTRRRATAEPLCSAGRRQRAVSRYGFVS